MAGGMAGAGPSTLNYAASGGYVAFSSDVSILEEYLRSSESQAKTLRELPGLAEAAQQVTGPGTDLFGYENWVETLRTTFESLKKSPGPSAAPSGLNPLPSALGVTVPGQQVKDWMNFSLLPDFDKVAKYFYFTVSGGSANVDGLTLKLFAPIPPQLKGAQGSGSAH
jgi:hypothetical protein